MTMTVKINEIVGGLVVWGGILGAGYWAMTRGGSPPLTPEQQIAKLALEADTDARELEAIAQVAAKRAKIAREAAQAAKAATTVAEARKAVSEVQDQRVGIAVDADIDHDTE